MDHPKENKIFAKKKFGQNFLHDKNIINNIVSAFLPQPGDAVLEIGPGRGAITDLLLKKLSVLNVVEIDRDLSHELRQHYGDKINLFNTDILDFDLNQLDLNTHSKIRVIGNLPYNISTPILFHLFAQIDLIQDMLFMLQLEVVDRMTAKPNCKEYGRLSIMTQFYCDTDKLFKIPPTAFIPQPKVDSAIVRLVPRNSTELNQLVDKTIFENVVRAAFNQRRKTITNSLRDFIKADDLISLNLDPKYRAENMSVSDYISISNFVAQLQ